MKDFTKARFLSFILIFLFCTFTFSQKYDQMSFSELKDVIDQTENHFKSIGRATGILTTEKIIEVSEKLTPNQEYYLKGRSYNFLGDVYYSTKDFKKALKNYKIAELFTNELKGYPELTIEVNNNIALVYINGYNMPNKALQRIKSTYENSDDLNEHSKHILALNLANIYLKTRSYKKAFELLEKCRAFFVDRMDDLSKLATTYMIYGDYYDATKNYRQAAKYYQIAANVSENNQLFRQAMTIYKKYEQLLVRIGKEDQAYAILKKYTRHHQTALELEKLESEAYKEQLTVSEQKTNIETQKAQQSKTISILTLSLLLLCLILFCFFIYNHRKTKILGKYLKLRNEQLKIEKEKSDNLAAVKTKFISTVSHELRTPLYGVVGLSSILMEKIQNKENRKFLKLMKFSADHLLNLVNDVLQVTKMESYEITLDESPYQIRNLADDIKNSFEYQTEQNGNTLHVNFDSEVPKVLIGDPVRLSQIFINLISNANKFTKNGNIWLNFIKPKIKDNKVEITFEIEDDGRGIPADKQEIIFNKFSQADTKDHSTGTGLGLHIVKNLVALHGGEIKLDSTAGKGSKFYFTLSLEIAKDAMEDNNTEDKNLISIVDTKQYNILIVEDNKINQLVTQNILKSKGYKSEIADNGKKAIEMAKNKEYDLILMDINMPIMGGMEATEAIRNLQINVPIVALTASDTEDTVDAIMHPDSGFNGFLRKPFKNEEFFKLIEMKIMNNNIQQAS